MKAATPTLTCPACRQVNHPPFLFCTHCNHPLLQLGAWRVTINLVAFFGLFTLTYLLRSSFGMWIVWPWTIYLAYVLLFGEVALWMVRGIPGQMFMLVRWWGIGLAGFAAYFEYRNRYGEGLTLLGLSMLPGVAREFPWAFYPGLAAILVLFLVPPFFRWGRRYGWINAYRIVAMTIILLSLIGLASLKLAYWIYLQNYNEELTRNLRALVVDARPDYEYVLWNVAFQLGRILIFELFIHASIKGYGQASRVRFKATADSRESGLTRALTTIVIHMRRFVLTLENTVHTIMASLWILAKDLGRVALDTLREIVAPMLCIGIAGWILYLLTNATDQYIQEPSRMAAAEIVGSVLVLLAALITFLGCKTPLRWSRLVANQMQLFGWLLPNLMVFFLLVSLTLAGAAAVLNRPDEMLLPYHVGPMTISVAGLLGLMVIYIMARKWSKIVTAQGTEEPIEGPDEPVDPEHQAEEEAKAAAKEKKEQGGLKGKARELGGQAVGVAKLTTKFLGDRVSGKPMLVDRLEETNETLRQKNSQLENLEAMKATLTPETLKNLRMQYKSEQRVLVEQRQMLVIDIQARLADRKREEGETVRQIEYATTRIKEIDKLVEGNVLDPAKGKTQRVEMESLLKSHQAKLKHCRQQIEMLEPALAEPETS